VTPAGPGGREASRHEARRLAIDLLYQADVTRVDPAVVLAEREGRDGGSVPAYTRSLVEGVAGHLGELDRTIGRHAEGWSVDRMPTLDRTILRIATYELTFPGDVPAGAAIDEAVRAAKKLSTEDSGRFVNGVLGEIARSVPVREGGDPAPA
jgi:N utilization substance protein B